MHDPEAQSFCKKFTQILPAAFAWSLLLVLTILFYVYVFVWKSISNHLKFLHKVGSLLSLLSLIFANYRMPALLTYFKFSWPVLSIAIVELLLFLLAVANFFASTVMDPGIYPPGQILKSIKTVKHHNVL